MGNHCPTGSIVYHTLSRVSIPHVWNDSMADEVTGIAGISRRLVRARRLLSADRDKPVTQREIAEAVGVTEGQVGHWEKGRQKPDLDMIELLAVALNVRPEWIAYGTEPRTASAQRPSGPVLRVAGLEIPLATLQRVSDEEIAEGIEVLRREEAQRAAPARPAPKEQHRRAK